MNKALFILFPLFFPFLLLSSERPALFERQWALENTGQFLTRATGELTREKLPGIVGMDINWVSPQEIQQLLEKQGQKALERQTIVAVIDSGLDLNHPGFTGRLWENPDCEGLSDEDRPTRPCQGWNFLDNNSDLKDDQGHGTHVAGIISANPEKSQIIGVAPEQVKIMPLKVLNKDIEGLSYNNKIVTDIIADAIIFAISMKVDVINMSLGWPKLIHTPRMQGALKKAQEEGVLIVAATGNNNKNVPTYPCTTPGILCVGANDHRGEISSFSNHSGKVDLVAPGESIISLYPGHLESRSLRVQGHEIKKGSSQAAPYVSGAAAVLKLLNPQMTLAELKARLTHTTTSLRGYNTQKTTKHGLLNMRAAIENETFSALAPDFKELLEIEIEESGQFKFKLPFMAPLRDLKNIQVELEQNRAGVELKNSSYEIKELSKGERLELKVSGIITDWNMDAHTHLKVKVFVEREVVFQGQTNLAYSRSILKADNLKQHILKGIHPQIISFFGRQQKGSRMRRVSDIQNSKGGPEWFFIDPRLQNGPHSVVEVMNLNSNGIDTKRLKTPKFNQLLSVFKADINQDGESDYMVYALNQDRASLSLSVYNQQGEPLFPQGHHWVLPITEFEGLPLKNGIENFSWIKLPHEDFGEILVPSFHNSWTLPDEDNTNDLLDRLNVGMERRPYYLNPVVKDDGSVELKPRTLQNYDFISELRKRGVLDDFDSLVTSNALAQDLNQRANGEIEMILLAGRENAKQSYKLKFESVESWSLTPIYVGVTQIEGNANIAFRNLHTLQSSSTLGFMALIDRSTARLSLVDRQQAQTTEFKRIKLPTGAWEDPIFNTLGAFEAEGSQHLFLETRYHVYSISSRAGRGEKVQTQKLPINRDSSFPGLSFSETLKPVAISAQEGHLPGLLVNSGLIYGDRIYSMVHTNGEFKRPVALSYTFPENCLYLDTAQIDSLDQALVLCQNKSRSLYEQMELIQVPLTLD